MNKFMKIFAFIASLFGLTTQAAETKMVDPKSILFSTPTLNDALPAYQSKTNPGLKLFQLHEDAWRQFEAISSVHAPAIEQELVAIRKIHETASVKTKMGDRELTAFRSIHVRKLITRPISSGLKISEIAALADKHDEFAGFSLSGSAPAVGGYAFQVGNLVIYGQADGDSIVSLCLAYNKAPQLAHEKAELLAATFEKHQLLVIHWPSATKLDLRTQFVEFLTQSPE